MSLLKNIRTTTALRWIALAIFLCLLLIYAGGLLLGFATSLSAFFLRLLELIGLLLLPTAGFSVLAWFAYKLLLQPLLRQRKLDRIREYRAQRAFDRGTTNGDQSDSSKN